MAPCFKSILCVVLLVQAPAAWAQSKQEPQAPLQFGPVAEMKRRGQTASVDYRCEVKLALNKIKSGYLGQPVTMAVEIHNIGTRPTPRDASLLITIRGSAGTEEYGLRFGEVVPKEKRTVRFDYTPLLPSLDVAVTEGIWDSNSWGSTNERAELHLATHYDPQARWTDFLPVRPHTAGPQPVRLPAKLSDVPEVFLAEPINLAVSAGRFQIASDLAKITHVNQKKTDAFMELLLSQRSDLSGLPFVLGNACRRQGENRTQFAQTTKTIRDIQRRRALAGPAALASKGADHGQMSEVAKALAWQRQIPAAVQVAALWQMIGAEPADDRLELVKHLHGRFADVDAARALAKLAIFSEEESIRLAAFAALTTRRNQDYADILVDRLNYPWPAVAERAGAAIAKLELVDLAPQLRETLNRPDPRAPQTRMVDRKPKTFVRELVRINHLQNCMLCHPSAGTGPGQEAFASRTQKDEITADVPIPGQSIFQYYSGGIPELWVRFDVAYLRQDFSVSFPVEKADPWPKMQRYDFVVRTREVSNLEGRTLRYLLSADAASPYHRAARAALSALTGRDPDAMKGALAPNATP
jgi:hypothetical protein